MSGLFSSITSLFSSGSANANVPANRSNMRSNANARANANVPANANASANRSNMRSNANAPANRSNMRSNANAPANRSNTNASSKILEPTIVNTLRKTANNNSKAHEAAPVGAQVTTASGATYTKASNGNTGTVGPSMRGGRRKNCWTRKNKSRKNKTKNRR